MPRADPGPKLKQPGAKTGEEQGPGWKEASRDLLQCPWSWARRRERGIENEALALAAGWDSRVIECACKS